MSIIGYHAPALRRVAESLGLPPVRELARLPGVQAVCRVTVVYHDGRASNSAATLKRIGAGAALELGYQRALAGKTLLKTVPLAQWERLAVALAGLGFDRLPDQPTLPDRLIADLWLVERAAGSFARGVILAPALADGDHLRLAEAVRAYLPEALREVE